MSHGLNPFTIWLLLWYMWFSVPSCGGDCQQGRKPCNCKQEQAKR